MLRAIIVRDEAPDAYVEWCDKSEMCRSQKESPVEQFSVLRVGFGAGRDAILSDRRS